MHVGLATFCIIPTVPAPNSAITTSISSLGGEVPAVDPTDGA